MSKLKQLFTNFRSGCLIVVSLLILIIMSPLPASAEQPETNLTVDVWARLLTGYFDDKNLEIITTGENQNPDPAVVSNENLPKTCVVGEPDQCVGTVDVYYPETGNSRTEEVTGDCRSPRTDDGSKPEPGSIGTCTNYKKRPRYFKTFLGADTSAKEAMPISKYQSYSARYDRPGCQATGNNLNCGIHNLLLPRRQQAKLRLSLIYKAVRTYLTYTNEQNVRKELPVGGVNWKEQFPCVDPATGSPKTFELLNVWGLIPESMHPGSDGSDIPTAYQKIWETYEPDVILPDSTNWFDDWYNQYLAAKDAGEPWTQVFDCAPLYPHDTNEPTLMISSILIAATILDNPFIVPFHSTSLVPDLGAKAAFEAANMQASLLNSYALTQENTEALEKIDPLMKNYYTEPKVTFNFTPCMLVYNNADKCSSPGNLGDDTKTPFTAVDDITLGRILDRNNIYFNRIFKPPREFTAQKGEQKTLEEANAVHAESAPTFLENIASAVFNFIGVSIRTHAVCGPYCQANRFLEGYLYGTKYNYDNVVNDNRLARRPVNVIPDDTGGLTATSERSQTIKASYSVNMACSSPDRADYENTPRQVAEGTSTNTCADPVSGDIGTSTCDANVSDAQVTAATQQISNKYGLPPKTLEAIFKYEGSTVKMGDACQEETQYKVMGPMQISAGTYRLITCDSERFSSPDQEKSQCGAAGKLSRCSLENSIELAARTLLQKLNAYGYYGGSYACNASKVSVSSLALYRAVNAYSGCGQIDGKSYAQFICEYAGNCPSPIPPLPAEVSCAGN